MRFEYLEPKTIEEAIYLLRKYDGKAKVIAGGTDIVPQLRRRLIQPEYLVDITHISGLDFINYDDTGGLRVGALTTVRHLEESAELKRSHSIIPQAASKLGSMAIRNIATIGGNLCNAAPSAETAPALLALLAKAKVVGPDGERMVSLQAFFAGPGKTTLKTGELLVEVQVPALTPGTGGAYLKHSFRGSIDLAIVGVAAVVTIKPGSKICQDIRIALGAVAPTPIRARKAEEILRGNNLDYALVAEAAQVASRESRCMSDVRATAEYREEIVAVLTRHAIGEAIIQA